MPCDLTVKLISINCPRFVACVNRAGPGSTPFALLPCFAVGRCVELSAWSGTGLSLDSLQTNCLSLHHDRTLLPTPRMSLAHRFSKKQKQPFAFLHHILSFKKCCFTHAGKRCGKMGQRRDGRYAKQSSCFRAAHEELIFHPALTVPITAIIVPVHACNISPVMEHP